MMTKERRQLTDNKTLADTKGLFFVRIRLVDLFGFADQEKITYGLGYQLILKRNTNNDAIYRTMEEMKQKLLLIK